MAKIIKVHSCAINCPYQGLQIAFDGKSKDTFFRWCKHQFAKNRLIDAKELFDPEKKEHRVPKWCPLKDEEPNNEYRKNDS